MNHTSKCPIPVPWIDLAVVQLLFTAPRNQFLLQTAKKGGNDSIIPQIKGYNSIDFLNWHQNQILYKLTKRKKEPHFNSSWTNIEQPKKQRTHCLKFKKKRWVFDIPLWFPKTPWLLQSPVLNVLQLPPRSLPYPAAVGFRRVLEVRERRASRWTILTPLEPTIWGRSANYH